MNKFEQSLGYLHIVSWLNEYDRTPFSFQRKSWEKINAGYSGMVVAPTGFGKTYSVFLGILIDFMNHPDSYKKGLKAVWITPIRSLAKDLARAMQEVVDQIGLDWVVEVRNGDTDVKIKQRQSKQMPDILLLTPESWHLLLAQKGRDKFFTNLKAVVIDEWHELLSSKRGVMVELAIAYLKCQQPKLMIWGITATIGNLDEAMHVLIPYSGNKVKIVAKEKKLIEIVSVFPPEVEVLPWAGHLGGKLVEQVVPIILESKSTIVFTNTRSQSEYWYQILLDAYPDFAGQLALHHGSIDIHIRTWIEEALSEGRLKAVVSTSSLDLGVDFKPVDTVVQIGSSKGVARFIQRAGRSGHSPFEVSKIYFVPTHSLELIEVSALKEAVKTGLIEDREPIVLCYDVLVQFLVTIALGGGFVKEEMYEIVKSSFSFQWITAEEWDWCISFITIGGKIGKNYEEFHKVVKNEEGYYVVEKRRIGMLHRMNIGVIVSDAMVKVKFLGGGYVGMVEEYFITKLKQGDKFILAGRVLELIRMKEMTAYVRASQGKAITPSWLGGRLPLSSNLGALLRKKLADAKKPSTREAELKFLHPLVNSQEDKSHIPSENEFLVELIKTREGYHLFMYPFEGRLVHEVMSSLMAYRISQLYPISFSMAMNDYGFELFSDKEIVLNDEQLRHILRKEDLMKDVTASINAAEMAKRKFRDIAVIGGYVIQNIYGKQQNNKSLQASSGIIFQVLEEHEPNNLLLRQAYTEVFNQQLEEPRLMRAFERINSSAIIYKFADSFTPLSFPIKVDSLRQSLSSEDLGARIQRMQEQSNRLNRKRR
ncbi:ligase-associated DNA damage response DEXH box helicase [Sphingobacterium bovistauri]|uniref:Ligase-associated DNA damage response DEXH box helicase n=1 Tax=Sphingobacterium bovistauri TaxID=2781959 RepID=A0ABS7Z475_9SPHI|nr:ligase-associated DNA damage response DEXH box helicase [Sphingobacterium bovistauri]MCA5003685.1 ligase-associated DNA damage response DEXH box helicase [Sphingobacterium bovistauri]